jgi:hypothetical protein|tara:strand:+ start:115 stop:456 length:342 start_codon:yes stop_codon:yes gene_type:complete
MRESYLMAVSAADDAIVFPFSKIRNISCAADATIIIAAEPAIFDPTGADASQDIITLTITADTEVAVMKDLVQQMLGAQAGNGQSGALVVCDDVNSVFAHPDILSCTITRDAI